MRPMVRLPVLLGWRAITFEMRTCQSQGGWQPLASALLLMTAVVLFALFVEMC